MSSAYSDHTATVHIELCCTYEFILVYDFYHFSFLEVDYPNVNVSAENRGDAIFEVMYFFTSNICKKTDTRRRNESIFTYL